MTPIRALRNRIADHEPIIQWNLPRHYENVLRITGWLAPAAADWCRAHTRFAQVYPVGRIDLLRSSPSAID